MAERIGVVVSVIFNKKTTLLEKMSQVLSIPVESVYEEVTQVCFSKEYYLRPKTYTTEDPDAPWYEEVAIHKNALSVMVNEMC